MNISKQALVAVSIVFDLLDLTMVTQALPFIEIPVLIMHFLYAGPTAVFSMLDMVPGLGTLPFYTVAALLYKPKEEAAPPPPAPTPLPLEQKPPSLPPEPPRS